jgi:hypothetical protein
MAALCPPTGNEGAAGYIADDPLHPAVVFMKWPNFVSISQIMPYLVYNQDYVAVPDAWLADDVSTLQLILCIDGSGEEDKIAECHYTNGAVIPQYLGDVVVVAYDAHTGSRVGERLIPGSRKPSLLTCPNDTSMIHGKLQMPPPSIAEVEGAIQYFVTTSLQ